MEGEGKRHGDGGGGEGIVGGGKRWKCVRGWKEVEVRGGWEEVEVRGGWEEDGGNHLARKSTSIHNDEKIL